MGTRPTVSGVGYFPAEFILLCERWYLKFNVSYRHLAERMQDRGFEVHRTPIYRSIQTYGLIMNDPNQRGQLRPGSLLRLN